MAGKFQIGDLVQLKSGGPVMTVESEYSENLHCQWFSGKKLEKGSFNKATLVKAEEPSK